mmetsp:Transcript_9208/g.23075  ORF Transcript_9208/g.23075 Transcript_9208/m.23075 type:complete len:253 (+) Transcript_9208:827-1585(+)
MCSLLRTSHAPCTCPPPTSPRGPAARGTRRARRPGRSKSCTRPRTRPPRARTTSRAGRARGSPLPSCASATSSKCLRRRLPLQARPPHGASPCLSAALARRPSRSCTTPSGRRRRRKRRQPRGRASGTPLCFRRSFLHRRWTSQVPLTSSTASAWITSTSQTTRPLQTRMTRSRGMKSSPRSRCAHLCRIPRGNFNWRACWARERSARCGAVWTRPQGSCLPSRRSPSAPTRKTWILSRKRLPSSARWTTPT